MALTVNTNTAAINALTNYQHTNRALNNSFQKISSGLRITKAADDAAGLAVAENLDAQGQSLRQAKRNINDGISIVQTAEGGANTVGTMLKRFRELLVEGSSETLNSTERSYVHTELAGLKSEMGRVAVTLEFNGISLFNPLSVQVGIHNTANDRIQISFGHIGPTGGLSIPSLSLMRSAAGMQNHISTIDIALDRINTARAKYGAVQNRLSSALNNLEVYTENVDSAQSQIRDADFAHETAEMAKFQIMAQAGTSVLAQANQINQGALRLLG